MNARVYKRGSPLVVHGAARVASILVRAVGRGSQGHGQVGPVSEVFAHGVPPMLLCRIGAMGVMLVEEVRAPFPLDQSVGIIHPIGQRQKVVSGSIEEIHMLLLLAIHASA